jgi:hypothetical protein
MPNNADPARSAFSKLDSWFAGLTPDEQVVIADVLRRAAAHAADEAAEGADEVSGYGMPVMFGALSPANTPNLSSAFPVLHGAFSGSCGENRSALGQPLSMEYLR